jgi:protein SCO1/2
MRELTKTPRTRGPVLAVAGLTTFLLAPGCGRSIAPSVPSSADNEPSVAEPSVTTYKLVGVVRAVDLDRSEVRIRHEAIPGFMNAMTMSFAIKDRATLGSLHPGDEIEGVLRVETEAGEVKDYELTGLVVSRPAAATGLTLSLSGGRPEVKAASKSLLPGDPVPDFAMTTEDGETLRLSELRGKVVALTFIYTRCPLPDFCPRIDRKFSDLADRIAAVPQRADQVRLLSVSIDPENDTPAVLKKHAHMRGAKRPLWTFAVAKHEELAKVAGGLGLVYGPGNEGIVHNLALAVIDGDGRILRLETGGAARTLEPVELLKTMYSHFPSHKK